MKITDSVSCDGRGWDEVCDVDSVQMVSPLNVFQSGWKTRSTTWHCRAETKSEMYRERYMDDIANEEEEN